MDTNFFGALWVCQAVMPYLRSQRSGHIIQITSIGAIYLGVRCLVFTVQVNLRWKE
ncbi:SDR family NAD(P)-dependent oxidoreductase [Escherichia coli]|uniref:SDR family NAD(P)-dependent oxidoreductase n=1 Tax=Escherichia coli TaxID=562 RepID=UPI00389026E6